MPSGDGVLESARRLPAPCLPNEATSSHGSSPVDGLRARVQRLDVLAIPYVVVGKKLAGQPCRARAVVTPAQARYGQADTAHPA